jgi:uncharacterized protein
MTVIFSHGYGGNRYGPNGSFTHLILTIIPMLADADLNESLPIKAVHYVAPCPILFIHSKGDSSIPYNV